MFKIFILFLLIFLDFFSKKIVYDNIDLNNFIFVNSFFEIGHIHNFGISFGLFANIFPSLMFIIFGIFITILIIILYIKSDKKLEKWGFVFIISGALANIFDRSLNGYVIDFLYFHYKEIDWFIFNFADIYISIGVFIIVLQILYDMNKRLNK